MKTCPFCAEQIQDDAIKCRYCGSWVSGGATGAGQGDVGRVSRPADTAGAGRRFNPGDVSGEPDAEVRNLLVSRQKIHAIKRVRDATGLGLKEAKDYVEAIERELVRAHVIPPPAPHGARVGFIQDPRGSSDVGTNCGHTGLRERPR